MDGMLSQDEINALLNGIDLTDESDDDVEAAPDGESNEIDESLLSDVEKDAIGEVANISMGSSATTLYSLVNRKVDITTPTVSLANWSGVLDAYERPCVFIQINQTCIRRADIYHLAKHCGKRGGCRAHHLVHSL